MMKEPVDKLLASWPVGTLATDEERAKMGMEPMDPEERAKRQAEIDQDPVIQGEIARLEGEGLQVAGRPPPPKVPPKRKKKKQKKQKKKRAFVMPPREPARREFSPTQADVAAADAALKKMEAELAATLQSPESAPPPPPPTPRPREGPQIVPRGPPEKSPEERRAAAGRGAAHAPLATPAAEPVKPAAEAPLAAETQETAPAAETQPPAPSRRGDHGARPPPRPCRRWSRRRARADGCRDPRDPARAGSSEPTEAEQPVAEPRRARGRDAGDGAGRARRARADGGRTDRH